jgi:hypothetical protein
MKLKNYLTICNKKKNMALHNITKNCTEATPSRDIDDMPDVIPNNQGLQHKEQEQGKVAFCLQNKDKEVAHVKKQNQILLIKIK